MGCIVGIYALTEFPSVRFFKQLIQPMDKIFANRVR